MQNNRTRYGMLVVTYAEDENNIHCTCDCGLKIIVNEKQLHDNSSCGCIYRKYLLSLSGMVDEDDDANKSQSVEYPEGRGLNFDKQKNKWRARITYQSKEYHLGYYTDKEAALEIRKEAESNMSGDFIEWYSKYKSKNTSNAE